MPRMHILESSGNNIYSVVVHSPTPAGNNSAGVPIATAIQNSGNNVTRLVVGNGAGQITNTESNQVLAGTVIETEFQWQDDPAWTNPQRTADLNTRASQAVEQSLAALAVKLKFFGQTVA